MDNKIITGHEPAYPIIPFNKDDRTVVETGQLYSGLTILQEFTRSAMQAYATSQPFRMHRDIAKDAVLLARETIEALNREAS